MCWLSLVFVIDWRVVHGSLLKVMRMPGRGILISTKVPNSLYPLIVLTMANYSFLQPRHSFAYKDFIMQFTDQRFEIFFICTYTFFVLLHFEKASSEFLNNSQEISQLLKHKHTDCLCLSKILLRPRIWRPRKKSFCVNILLWAIPTRLNGQQLVLLGD